MKLYDYLFAVLSVLVFIAACILAWGGCAAMVAALPTVIAAVTDGMMILDQIQQFVDAFFRAHPDAARQQEVELAIGKARSALVAAQRTATGATELDQGKADAAFADFKAAYQELLKLVGPLGVTQQGSALRASPGGLTVPEPEAMHLRVSR